MNFTEKNHIAKCEVEKEMLTGIIHNTAMETIDNILDTQNTSILDNTNTCNQVMENFSELGGTVHTLQNDMLDAKSRLADLENNKFETLGYYLTKHQNNKMLTIVLNKSYIESCHVKKPIKNPGDDTTYYEEYIDIPLNDFCFSDMNFNKFLAVLSIEKTLINLNATILDTYDEHVERKILYDLGSTQRLRLYYNNYSGFDREYTFAITMLVS